MKNTIKATIFPLITILFILCIAQVTLPTEASSSFWYPIDITGAIVCLAILCLTCVGCCKGIKKSKTECKTKMIVKNTMVTLLLIDFIAWIVIMIIGDASENCINTLRGLNWVALSLSTYLFATSAVKCVICQINNKQ
jgi:hypothetical protein